MRANDRDVYSFSRHDRADCPWKDSCLITGKRNSKAMARRREKLWLRGRIEAESGEQTNRPGLRRARYRSLARVTMQVLLNVIAVDIRRAAKLMDRQGSRPPQAALAIASGA